jgi:hypothetical protein
MMPNRTARERVEKAIREYSAECAAYAREADVYTDAKRVHGLNILGGCLAEVVAAIDALIAEVREEDAVIAETLGAHPAMNIYGGGPDWFKHGAKIAATIRARR